MAVVWKAGEINVREACERLGSSVAYTTVMTTMDRLFKKRLLAAAQGRPRVRLRRDRDARRDGRRGGQRAGAEPAAAARR